jgi:hypothetical protein
MAIKPQVAIFSHLRGRRDNRVVRLIGTANAKMTHLTRPAVIQENGSTKASELAHLTITIIAISRRGSK